MLTSWFLAFHFKSLSLRNSKKNNNKKPRHETHLEEYPVRGQSLSSPPTSSPKWELSQLGNGEVKEWADTDVSRRCTAPARREEKG